MAAASKGDSRFDPARNSRFTQKGAEGNRSPIWGSLRAPGTTRSGCDPSTGAETANLETDAPINSIIALPAACLVAGDAIGRLYWLEVVD
jgi:hypothetical protein